MQGIIFKLTLLKYNRHTKVSVMINVEIFTRRTHLCSQCQTWARASSAPLTRLFCHYHTPHRPRVITIWGHNFQVKYKKWVFVYAIIFVLSLPVFVLIFAFSLFLTFFILLKWHRYMILQIKQQKKELITKYSNFLSTPPYSSISFFPRGEILLVSLLLYIYMFHISTYILLIFINQN